MYSLPPAPTSAMRAEEIPDTLLGLNERSSGFTRSSVPGAFSPLPAEAQPFRMRSPLLAALPT
jgi:hypothetical protein